MSMNWLKKYLTIKYFVVLALVDLDVLAGDLVNLQLVLEPGAEKKFAKSFLSPIDSRSISQKNELPLTTIIKRI